MTTFNPGSPGAIANGCQCSILRNHDGEGEPINGGKNRRWYISHTCSMHSDFFDPTKQPHEVTP